MDYHLENEVLLSEKSKYESLYSWSLQELNKEGKQIGADQIPWEWSLYFTASELRHDHSININRCKKAIEKTVELTQDDEIITAMLHPGICRDGEFLEDDASYSMFGTNRIINEFDLRIYKTKDDNDKEEFHMWGCLSYTAEVDFRNETMNDTVVIYIGLPPQKFNKIAELIKLQRIDILEIRLSKIDGFYSEWSPSIETNNIKILADEECQKIVIQNECKINPPKLGNVGEFNMRIIQRHKLNPKQDLRSINISKIFEESDDHEENLTKKEGHQNDKNSLLLSQLARNELTLKKLRTPIWLIFISLCFLLIKFLL